MNSNPKNTTAYLLGQIDINVKTLVNNQAIIMENQEDFEDETKKRFEILEAEIKEIQSARMYVKGVWAVIAAIFGIIGGLLAKMF